MPTEHVLVLSTAPTESEALSLAHALVDARLAASVQVSAQVRAVYRWRGDVHDEPEWQLSIKTAADKVPDLVAWLPARHSYEVPELVVLPITGGWPPFLEWITAETRA
ncbi:divalent-cation tolerance protein CutA (plasmid) [Actinoplanes sp. CA-030573]|uniref:divalent-cation tolerance protein CutA n=1 Tax=Actinoplanes sp. CA-030573 TaxID=3239898 RepID=UPI003D8D28CE